MTQRNLTKQDAIDLFGSAAALARALGVSPPAVSRWGKNLTPRDSNAVLGAFYIMAQQRDAREKEILSKYVTDQ